MKVDPTSHVSSIRKLRNVQKKTSSSFSIDDQEETVDETSSLLDVEHINSTDLLLTLQSENNPVESAEDTLNLLEDLKLSLLSGTLTKDQLEHLSTYAHQQSSNDPKLQEILDDINIRVQVELAKYTRDQKL